MKIEIDLPDEQVKEFVYEAQYAGLRDSHLYERAINVFGKDRQMIHTMEECGELIQAIGKYLRPDVENTSEILRHIVEEVADVRIMCDQVECILKQYHFDVMKRKKLGKLKKQVEKYEENFE